jgi:hypothetical protein
MTELDREQLKRECADALEALHRTQSTDGLAGVADSLRALGPTYRFHGEQIYGALRDGNQNAITWNLIHVLEEFEKGEENTFVWTVLAYCTLILLAAAMFGLWAGVRRGGGW